MNKKSGKVPTYVDHFASNSIQRVGTETRNYIKLKNTLNYGKN